MHHLTSKNSGTSLRQSDDMLSTESCELVAASLTRPRALQSCHAIYIRYVLIQLFGRSNSSNIFQLLVQLMCLTAAALELS